MQPLSSYGQQIAAGMRRQMPERGGALILCDQFLPGAPGEAPHGMLVARVAAQAGFAGKVMALSFEDPADPAQQASERKQAELVEGWGSAQEPATIRGQLYESLLHTRLHSLATVTQRLLAAGAAGARQSVMNLSLGSTPALCLSAVLHMCQDPDTAEQAQAQLSKGFGLQPGDRAGLHRALVETAQATSADPRWQEAHADYAEGVRQFESQGNSVVIAAGNDGAIGRQLRCEVPAGLTRSDLIAPQVTVVGALENGQDAAYNGELPEGALLAPGAAFIAELGETVHGTSFAAPRVAAAMATLHAQFPELSSAEIERRLAG